MDHIEPWRNDAQNKSQFYAKFASTARTYSWFFSHEVGEVEVLPCTAFYGNERVWEPTRGWLWQVFAPQFSTLNPGTLIPGRIGVMLYSQRLEVIGQKKKSVKLRVSFFHSQNVRTVREARGWPAPPAEVLTAIQQAEMEEDEEAKIVIQQLWEVN